MFCLFIYLFIFCIFFEICFFFKHVLYVFFEVCLLLLLLFVGFKVFIGSFAGVVFLGSRPSPQVPLQPLRGLGEIARRLADEFTGVEVRAVFCCCLLRKKNLGFVCFLRFCLHFVCLNNNN